MVQTFTARITRDGQQPRDLPNCVTLPGGYLAKVEKQGRGKKTERGGLNAFGEGETWEEWESYEDVIVPIFDRGLLESAGLYETLSKRKSPTIRECQEKGWMQYVLRIGRYNGVEVVNRTEQREQDFLAAKKVTFQSHYCWETGITWYQLIGRYPTEVFSAIRPYLMYHAEQYEEEGNWKGWAVGHHATMPDVVAAIEKVGWTSNYSK